MVKTLQISFFSLLIFFGNIGFVTAQSPNSIPTTPTNPNGTTSTTSTSTPPPTSDAALSLYPANPNPVLTTTVAAPTDTTGSSTTTNTSSQPTDTGTPTTTTAPAPIRTVTQTVPTTPSCPNTNPLQPTFQNCPPAETKVIQPQLPYLLFGGPVVGIILFYLIISSLYKSRLRTANSFDQRKQNLQYQNHLDQETVSASESMLDLLRSQIGSGKLDQTGFNKLASKLEILAPKNFQPIINELRSAFNSNDSKKVAELTVKFRDTLKAGLKK